MITACQQDYGLPEDADWTMSTPPLKSCGLFLPPKHPSPRAAWEVIEWYARGLNLIRAGAKVGVTSNTAMDWMKRIGAPRRKASNR
ncbi:hypothetical protein [Amycolatopsis sp. NPDC003861]